MNTKPVSNPQRNYGIDALRLVSIFMVVMLHVMGFGGILKNVKGVNAQVVALIWVICYCSVNCFAIISGYVSYSDQEKPHRFSKYASMWLQVVFYSFGLSLLAFLVKPELVNIKTLIKHALPVSTGHYWYFTAYSFLFFLIPWLNKLVRSSTQREMNLLALILFVLFSCLSSFSSIFEVGMGLDGGYSFLWLAVLYLIGAWMKKCDIPGKIKPLYALLCAVFCVLATWLGRGLLGIGALLTYISPTIILLAAALVVLFARLRPRPIACRLIAFAAPAAFGVYLLHLQLTVVKYCIKNRFLWIADSPVWLIPLQLVLCAGAIFIACLLVEKGRILLFSRLGINRRAEALCSRIGRKLL